MDDPLTAEQMAEVKEAIFRGQKIAAIKIYRGATGTGLADAKAAVEKLEAELRATSPEYFKKSERRGCLGVLVLLVVFIIFNLIFFL